MTENEASIYVFFKWYSYLPDNLKQIFKEFLGPEGLKKYLKESIDERQESNLNIVLPFLNKIYGTNHESIVNNWNSSTFIESLKNKANLKNELNFKIEDIIYILFLSKLNNQTFRHRNMHFILRDILSLNTREGLVKYFFHRIYRESTCGSVFEKNLLKDFSYNSQGFFEKPYENTMIELKLENIGAFNHGA